MRRSPRTKKPVVLFVPWSALVRFPDRIAGELAAEGFVTAGHGSLG